MNLVFNEYLQFLKDKGVDIDKYNLKEGYYWLDNLIIKAYDKKGNIYKILRIHIDDNLDITTSEYKNKPFEIESWNDTIQRNLKRLIHIEHEALELIEKYSENEYKDYTKEILSSTGKDSMVVGYLVRKLYPETQTLFNNTSLDCADTYKFVKTIPNTYIINPKEGFYQWRKRLNFVGNRMSRACCTVFKEGVMIDVLDKNKKYLFFMGMRNEESNTRSEYGDLWKNEKWNNREWQGVLPIRKWNEEDVWLYTLWRNIPINNKYKKGYARVGCAISCAFYSKSTWVLDKYWYPQMYNRWHNILDEDFEDNQKWCIMNCTKDEYHTCWNGGMYRDEPTKDVIKEFAEYKGISKELALKYFNKTCMCCGKKLKKDDIALSMKYYGRNIEKFKCMKCTGKDLELSKDELKQKIQEFKLNGCELF